MGDAAAERVLLDIKSRLDASRTRTIDLFRKIDHSGDGNASAAEFREGLAELGFAPSEHDFSLLLARLDKDGSGDVTLKELDRALRQAEKQAMVPAAAAAAARMRVEKRQQEQREQSQSQQQQQQRVQEPLAPMDRGDEVLCAIRGVLNKRKTRMVDVFRAIDKSGDGLVSVQEFRDGLAQLGVPQPDEDLAAIMAGLDRDGSGDVNVKEFDKALKLAEKKARAEGKAAIIDTWDAVCSVGPQLTYNWSCRSIRTDVSVSLSAAGAEILTPRSSGGERWHAASAGPLHRALSAKIGSGSLQDSSVRRQRILDFAGSPNSLPPTLRSPQVSVSGQPRGRFEKHPASLPHEGMASTVRLCTEATRGSLQQIFDRGVRKYPNTPMMQSTVDQVVFNRDMDFSGEDKFDAEFTAMFDGMAGQPSWTAGGR